MSSELIIPSVTLEDSGIYICTATLHGTMMHTTITVNVHGEYVRDRLYPFTFSILLVNLYSDFDLFPFVVNSLHEPDKQLR